MSRLLNEPFADYKALANHTRAGEQIVHDIQLDDTIDTVNRRFILFN